jgi:hypothetical protein
MILLAAIAISLSAFSMQIRTMCHCPQAAYGSNNANQGSHCEQGRLEACRQTSIKTGAAYGQNLVLLSTTVIVVESRHNNDAQRGVR